MSFSELYFNNIDSDVPIPNDCFGFTVNCMISSFNSPCDVETDTVAFSLSTFAVTCVKLDSIEYLKSVSSSFEVNDLKNKPSVVVVNPTSVVKPIKFLDLFITNNCWDDPVSGILNVLLSLKSETTMLLDPPFVKVTCWFCVNGWSGMNILWFKIDVGIGILPIIIFDTVDTPVTVPIPNSCVGLKNILSSNFDSK